MPDLPTPRRRFAASPSRPTNCFACGSPLVNVFSSQKRLDRCPACGLAA